MYQRKLFYLVIPIFMLSCSTLEDNNNHLSFDHEQFYDMFHDTFNDMFLRHEGIPAGVPDDYDWRTKPRLGAGTKVPSRWNAVTAWGQFYADKSMPHPDKDFPLARVHLKDLQLYILRNNGEWDLIQDTQNPTGYLYVEDFANDKHKRANIKKESGGGISTKAGSGYNFHFFPDDFVKIDRTNIKGVFIVCKARLIGTENYDTLPKYLLNVGGDYWRSLNAEFAGLYRNNVDIGIGRFKYVTPEWQYFTMHTFSKEEAEQIVFSMQAK